MTEENDGHAGMDQQFSQKTPAALMIKKAVANGRDGLRPDIEKAFLER